MNINGGGKRNRGMIKTGLLYGKPYNQETLAEVQLRGLHRSNVLIYVLHQISTETATTMFGK